jgi:proline iminopeptidase
MPGEGYVDVPGGRIWYRVVGSGPGTPLLLLHGGPGAPSYYLKPLAALADERPVIFYDQLGAGHSDQVSDTTLWKTERFVQEIEALRKALNLTEIHLLGHSWGTILGAEYLFTRPSGVRSVIFASPALSMNRWVQDTDSLRHLLPDSVQAVIDQHEAAGTFEDPAYQEATMLFYQQFLARKQPWSADIDSTFSQMNPSLYGYMNGPSEFTITGTLKEYDATPRLGELALPTLFTTGEFDEATPATVRYYHSLVPGSQLAIIEDSGHLTMHDAPERNVAVVRDFLRQVEGQ